MSALENKSLTLERRSKRTEITKWRLRNKCNSV